MLKLIKKFLKQDPKPAQPRARITIASGRVSHLFAIGDIHGHLDLLLAAEQRIFERMRLVDGPALVVCVGDFIDRGPNSKEVIDHLIKKMPPPLYRVCICGNHDDAFLNFLKEDRFDPMWLGFGGDTTLLSYGVDVAHLLDVDPTGVQLREAARAHVPDEHVEFLRALPVALSVDSYLFVHAGVVPGKPLSEQSDFDLMWIREPFLSVGPELDITVVHGHTPSGEVQFGRNRLGIDTGAYATGKLSVVHIGPHGIAEI